MIKYIANILTGFRIIGSVLLLLFPALALEFYITYLMCGVSDMIDGTIARKTNSVSEFGCKFDTIADAVFVTVSLLKLLPVIHITLWLWVWGGIITTIKIGNVILGYVLKKQFISTHTVMNKITGFLLLALPLTLSFVEFEYSSTVVCSIATISAIQEGIYVLKGRECK